jgi:hypothetical protein
MGRISLWLSKRHVAHVAVAFAIGVTTIPVVLGALAEPAAAATTSANSTISAQQAVADVECDIVWVEYDVKYVAVTAGPAIPPSCAPVPVGLQQALATLAYDDCLLGLYANGGHGFCIPPAT